MHPLCCQRDRPHPHTDQLLNHVVDCRAACRPQALFAEYPRAATTFEEGFQKITYGQLARSIDFAAHWLVREFGPGKDFETLAYVGPNDLRYPALVLGAIKAGFKILLLSPRNSVAAQLHLIQATQCSKFLTSAQRAPSVIEVASSSKASNVAFHDIPSLQDFLDARCLPFVYTKTLVEAASDPFVVMHTSGSTGMPKPVIWPQSFIPAYAKQWQLDPPAGMDSTDHLYQGNRAFVVFPPFHAAYAAHIYINGICNQTSIIFPLSGAIPSATQLSEALKHTTMDVAFLVPVMVEEISNSPELLNHISSNIDRICYSGGDLPRGCGDRVASEVELIAFYGTTEFASLALLTPKTKTPDDWKYVTFHPQASVEFRQYAEEMHELVIVRHPDYRHHQPTFATFPDKHEYHTKDLFLPHPSKPNLWTHCGRSDDIVVFLTGEKTNPVPYEQVVFARHTEIRGILLVGSQKFQAALLVELTNEEHVASIDKKILVRRFWPSIELANQSCPDHARVALTHVWFTDPKRPMTRSPKGTIQRAATLKEYADDIDFWYQQAESDLGEASNGRPLARHDTPALKEFIRNEARLATGIVFQDTENFFISGMQSLQALLLSQSIKTTLGDPTFAVGTVYGSPSICQLVASIQAHAEAASGQVLPAQLQDEIQSVLSRFSAELDVLTPLGLLTADCSSGSGLHILLTGSTGSLGAHVLDDLLVRPDVAHVYCLNRAEDGGLAQQLARARRAKSATEYHPDKVSFLRADMSKPDLGLESSILSRLGACIDSCIHNAWSVNFNTPLSAFEPQIKGVINLMRFCYAAAKRPHISFLSSVSAINNLSGSAFPEAVVDEPSAPSAMGYGASKYIAEHLLNYGSGRLGLHARILRVGQVAGPVGVSRAEWSQNEWVPSLVKSSHYVEALPQTLPSALEIVDWIPVDVLSSIVTELSVYAKSTRTQPTSELGINDNSQCEVYNILNPQPVSWSTLVRDVASALSPPPQLVSFPKWLETVRSNFSKDTDHGTRDLATSLGRNPAAKLLGFFEASQRQQRLHAWDTRAALRVSGELRTLESISSQWMQRWMSPWLK